MYCTEKNLPDRRSECGSGAAGDTKIPVSKKIFEDAEIVFTDGKPIIWMAKWLKRPIVEKISGPDLMELLCERAAKKGYRIFLLGAGPGVAANAAKNLEQRYPGFQCAGTYSPPMGFEKESKGDGKNHLNVKRISGRSAFLWEWVPRSRIFSFMKICKNIRFLCPILWERHWILSEEV